MGIAKWFAFCAIVTAGAGPILAQSPAQDFPDGPGKAIVVATCGGCHDINRLKVGYTPDGWRTVERMMRNMETPVPAESWPMVTEYLIKALPERARPPAVIIPGPVEANIKVWPVPTPGSRPHDPLASRDGAIWWTGQLSNRLGRLDPKTGVMKEFVLKSPHTGPHGLTEDKDGNIWFTGNNASLIGRLDPKTGVTTEYKLLDPAARDPHTLIFDKAGILWFTVQQSNMIGRLDPKTGDIKLVTSPTPKSRPYGMALDSKDQLFVVDFGVNKIAQVNTSTMEIKEHTLPNAASRPRRLAIAPDDSVWYSDFSRGMLGRLDPITGAVKEWPSPSGPKSEPYGIVFTKGALWYSESAAKPNTIVRFDPTSEKFQSWLIPGGGDIVRNMDVSPDGNPVLAHSLTNEVGLVEIK
jgi:virginiamycin B lyase